MIPPIVPPPIIPAVSKKNPAKKITIIAMCLFALTLLCAPWTAHLSNGASYSEFAPVFWPPDNGRLNAVALFCEWFGIAVLYFGCIAITRK